MAVGARHRVPLQSARSSTPPLRAGSRTRRRRQRRLRRGRPAQVQGAHRVEGGKVEKLVHQARRRSAPTSAAARTRAAGRSSLQPGRRGGSRGRSAGSPAESSARGSMRHEHLGQSGVPLEAALTRSSSWRVRQASRSRVSARGAQAQGVLVHQDEPQVLGYGRGPAHHLLSFAVCPDRALPRRPPGADLGWVKLEPRAMAGGAARP